MPATPDRKVEPAGAGRRVGHLHPSVTAAPRGLGLALAVAGIEGAALLAAAVYVTVEAIVGHPRSVAAALVIVLFAVAGAVLIVGLAYAVARRYAWARSPLVVLQIVFVPVGFSIGVQAGRTAYGIPILVLTVAMLGLLSLPESREALLRR